MLEKIKNIKNKLGKWFWVLTLVLVGLIVKFVFFPNNLSIVKIDRVKTGEITEVVSVTGSLKADNYANLTFQGGGRVSWVNVREGQKVKKGQGIAGLDTVILNASYQQALNNYRNYQAAADSVLDSLKDNSNDETFAQKATRTQAEVARDNAYDSLKAAEQNLRYATIFAPFDGVMAKVEPSFPGSNVTSLSASYVVVNPETIYFSGELSESDLPKVSEGQKVQVRLDAYPDEVFEGKLENIGVVAFTSSTGGNAYSLRISLPKNNLSKFRYGMEGDSDIILSKKENVLKVPFSSLINEDGKEYVWIFENGLAKKKQVEVGAISIDEVEIKSGVTNGDSVIIDPSLKLIDGKKVST